MKILIAIFLLSCAGQVGAWVVSPTSMEVGFSYTAEFQTASRDSASALMEQHAKYLFGYMQNPEMAKAWQIRHGIFGIGAPRWSPNFELQSETQHDGIRTIRYLAQGRLLLLKSVAATLLQQGFWYVTLPADLDKFYDVSCTDYESDVSPSEFWYFYDPFGKGCEALRTSPLADTVRIRISAIPAEPGDLAADLNGLRARPGQNLFLITTINGFNDGSTKRGDVGRENYEKMNAWFRSLGFKDTFIQRYKSRPIHQFDKIVKRHDGREIHIRIVRLLAQTDLEGSRDVTFAKFFEKSVQDSDVIVYEGHSGSQVDQDIALLEKRAGFAKLRFNRTKRQLFFFDACSSYSYYLDMFEGRKDPGTLNVLSDGLESVFDYEIPVTRRLYKVLFDVNDDSLTWDQIMADMEKPMRGFTSMLSVQVK